MSANSKSLRPAVELDQVDVGSRFVPDRRVVTKVYWKLFEGRTWAIGGLRQSGKSDFVSLTAGLMRPLQGSVRYWGTDITTSHEDTWLRERKRIGVVFERGRGVVDELTVIENLALPLQYHASAVAKPMDRINGILSETELHPFKDRYPGSLNREWRQRVVLARALALQPRVLILDDPLLGLESSHADWWLECLVALIAGNHQACDHSVTVVVAAESLKPWLNIAQEFALIQEGRWIEIGGRDELLGRRDDYSRQLWAGATSAD